MMLPIMAYNPYFLHNSENNFFDCTGIFGLYLSLFKGPVKNISGKQIISQLLLFAFLKNCSTLEMFLLKSGDTSNCTAQILVMGIRHEYALLYLFLMDLRRDRKSVV